MTLSASNVFFQVVKFQVLKTLSICLTLQIQLVQMFQFVLRFFLAPEIF